MNVALIAASSLGSLVTLLSCLSQTEIWQRKEYRWDRLYSWLKSREWPATVWPWVVVALVATDLAWLMQLAHLTIVAEGIAWLALLSFAGHHVVRIRQRGVFRPHFTVKAIVVLLVMVLGSGAYLYMMGSTVSPALTWATLLLVLPLYAAAVVGIVNIPFALEKQRIIWRAKRLRQRLTDITVVGITGSWGKTSTKHFLTQLLQHKTTAVIATAEHRNAVLPVAQDMLARLNTSHRYFIVEMGAYRQGHLKSEGAFGWGMNPTSIAKRLRSSLTHYSLRNWVWMVVKNVTVAQEFKYGVWIALRLTFFLLLSLVSWPLLAVWPSIVRGLPRMLEKRRQAV